MPEVSASDQGSAKAKAAGRHVAYFWAKHSKCKVTSPKQHSCVIMQCIYCSIIVDSCADQLQDHVVEHCKSITQEDRAEAQKHVDVTIKHNSWPEATNWRGAPQPYLYREGMRRQLDVGQSLLGKHASQQTAINRKSLMYPHK